MTGLYEILAYTLGYIGLFAASFYMINLLSFYKNKKEPEENTNYKVSIIIPAFNEEESIAKTIKSALSLDYPQKNYEIIVIDDGSADKTYSLAKKFESNSFPKVRVFTKKNGGKGTALNLGLKKVSGELIFTMDADTFVSSDALRKMTKLFSNKYTMAVTPAMGVFKPKTIWQRVQHIEYYMGVFLRKSFATMNAIHITPGAFSGYRKSFFDKHGGFDENNITEDLEVALRIQSYDYIIENAPGAAIYTLGPANLKDLTAQRRRWYTGLITNLWTYRKKLFGPKKGAMGVVVLPVAISTVVLAVALTITVLIKTLNNIKKEIISLYSVNFQFEDIIEFNKIVIETFFIRAFSHKIFLMSLLFLCLLWFYLSFSRREVGFKESLRLNFILFIVLYSFFFAFWWIMSTFYVLFGKKVVWRYKK